MVIRVNKLLRFFSGHEPDVNVLSAHLDGQLNPAAAAQLDAHLTSCVACRAAMDGLRATRDALRSIPDIETPRSFRLRAADVERRPSTAEWQASPMLRWAPAVSAVAAVVLVVALGVDLSSGGSSSSANRAPLAASQAGPAKSIENAGGAASTMAARAALSGDVAADGTAGRSTQPAAPAAAQPPAPGSSGATVTTPIPSSGGAQRYDATGTAAPELAARPVASPTSELQATSGREISSGDGNNLTALRVLEIIAGAIAVVAGATAIVVKKRRGDSL